MTDNDREWKAWVELCKRRWDEAAQELIDQGYERRNHDGEIIPATFHKDGQEMYLYRMLGFTEWYPAEMDWRVK